MKLPFDFVHLDPSCDPPEAYREMFELLVEFWDRLGSLREHAGTMPC